MLSFAVFMGELLLNNLFLKQYQRFYKVVLIVEKTVSGSITILNTSHIFEEPLIAPKFQHTILTVTSTVARSNR